MPTPQQDKRQLETVDIPAVEVFSEGTWNGDLYTHDDLQTMVDAFPLVGFEPTIKAGHPDGQEDEKKARLVFGAPALGYAKRIWINGKKLFAELKQVPKRFADLVKAGAFKRISAEIFWNYTHETSGQKYPRVLKSIAFLGAEIPALTDLAAIESLYEKNVAGGMFAYDEKGNEFRAYGVEIPYEPTGHQMDENRLISKFREMLDSALSMFGSDGKIRSYMIEKRGEEWCLIAKSTGKTLGCHPSEALAQAQERAVQANKNEMLITAKQLEDICPPCAEKMRQKNFSAIKLLPMMSASGVLTYAFPGGMPQEAFAALCEKFSPDEGFRTRCMDSSAGGKADDPGAFCNSLKTACKDQVMLSSDQPAREHIMIKLHMTREEVSNICLPCGEKMAERGITALTFTADQVAKFAEHGDVEKCMAKADMLEKYPDENKRKAACEKAMGEAMMQAIQEIKGGPTMDEKKFEQEKAQLEADKKAAEAKAKEYQDKLSALQAANEEAKGKESEALQEVKKLKRERHDDQIKSWLAAQKRAGKLAPVEEARLTAIFSTLYEDQRTVTFAKADGKETKESLADAVKAFIVSRPSIFKELSRAIIEPTEPLEDAGEEVDRQTKEYMEKKGMKVEQYAEAMKAVLALKENEDLAVRWVCMQKQ